MFFAPIHPNNQILQNPSFIASLIISILGFRLGSILIILMTSDSTATVETFGLLISILGFRLGSGLIILMQLLRSGENTLHNGRKSQTCILDFCYLEISILGFRLGSDLIILMPEFPPRFPPRPRGQPITIQTKKLRFSICRISILGFRLGSILIILIRIPTDLAKKMRRTKRKLKTYFRLGFILRLG